MNDSHFKWIFWFVVLITGFGMFFSIYILITFKGEVAERFADQLLMFWMPTAVASGIGYLIGNSVNKNIPIKPLPAGATVDSETIITETTKEKTTTDPLKQS